MLCSKCLHIKTYIKTNAVSATSALIRPLDLDMELKIYFLIFHETEQMIKLTDQTIFTTLCSKVLFI